MGHKATRVLLPVQAAHLGHVTRPKGTRTVGAVDAAASCAALGCSLQSCATKHVSVLRHVHCGKASSWTAPMHLTLCTEPSRTTYGKVETKPIRQSWRHE